MPLILNESKSPDAEAVKICRIVLVTSTAYSATSIWTGPANAGVGGVSVAGVAIKISLATDESVVNRADLSHATAAFGACGGLPNPIQLRRVDWLPKMSNGYGRVNLILLVMETGSPTASTTNGTCADSGFRAAAVKIKLSASMSCGVL